MTAPAATTPDLLYDYMRVPAEHRGAVIAAAYKVKLYASMSLSAVGLVGSQLADVKGRLPHGAFLEWIEGEFGMQERTCQNYMNAHRFLAGKSESLADLDGVTLEAAYRLGSGATPEGVRKAAYEAVNAGQRVTRAWVLERMGPAAAGQRAAPSAPRARADEDEEEGDVDVETPAPGAVVVLTPEDPRLTALLQAAGALLESPAGLVVRSVPRPLRRATAERIAALGEWLVDLEDLLREEEGEAAGDARTA